MRVFENKDGVRTEVAWRAHASPLELAQHVNEQTRRVHETARWPEWWALRCSRRLPMEPWAQDLAAAFALRRLLAKGGTYEVEGTSPTLPLLFKRDEAWRLRFDSQPREPEPRPWWRACLWALKKLRNRWLLRRLSKPWKQAGKFHVLFHTVVLPESVLADGQLFDMFFPGVHQEAESRGKRAFTLGFAPALPSRVRAWKRSGNWAILDEVIGLREFLAVAKALKSLRGKVEAWAQDVGDIPAAWLKARWRDDLQQSEFFESVAAAEWAGNFCRRKNVETFLYSFERKTFEQAMLQAVHEASPATRTCAYQNAALTNKHYHNWSYSGDADLLPGEILTVGDITTEILTTHGKYPPERVRIGGALRQRQLLERQALRRPLQNLLVIWAEGREQYEKFWEFLKQAWSQTDLARFHFRIRLHPAIPFDFPGGEPFAARYEVDPLADVRQSIDWADAVLYASTSLAIVAAASGIPVLSVRLRDFFDDDCIPPTGKMLHWRVDNPGELLRVLNKISELYDDDFEEYLTESKKFAAKYFHHTTPEGFLRTAGVVKP